MGKDYQVFCFVGRSKKVDWLTIGSSSSGEDKSVSRVSTNTVVKEEEANSPVDPIHSNVRMSRNRHQREEELLDIADEEDLGGGLWDRPSSSTNGRLATSINLGTPISLEEATALKEIILGTNYSSTNIITVANLNFWSISTLQVNLIF